MRVVLIAAMDLKRGIGKDNDLLWHLPADMKFFKETTTGQIVVMGRKNYESLPERFRPLPNRENAVLTRNQDFHADGCQVFNSLEACFDYYQDEQDRDLFIIGGGQIYCHALELGIVDEMFITHVDKIFEADTFFPDFEESDWQVTEILKQDKDDKHEAGFVIRHYRKN